MRDETRGELRLRVAGAVIAALVWIFGVLAEAFNLARLRTRCIRHGHTFLCITDGHLCTQCGRFWGDYD